MSSDIEFRTKLLGLINECSKENGSDTPDFILAMYLTDCLDTFDKATHRRDKWYGKPTPDQARNTA